MKTITTLIVSLMLVAACGEDYTAPADFTDSGGCAHPVPEFDAADGKLACNTGYASSDGTECLWPCADFMGVCGAEVAVSAIGGADFMLGNSPDPAPWCN